MFAGTDGNFRIGDGSLPDAGSVEGLQILNVYEIFVYEQTAMASADFPVSNDQIAGGSSSERGGQFQRYFIPVDFAVNDFQVYFHATLPDGVKGFPMV